MNLLKSVNIEIVSIIFARFVKAIENLRLIVKIAIEATRRDTLGTGATIRAALIAVCIFFAFISSVADMDINILITEIFIIDLPCGTKQIKITTINLF